MAIHPIDLQTLYSQMDKIGRQQSAEQQLAAAVRDEQQVQNKLDAQKRLSSVQTIEQSSSQNIKIGKDGGSDERDSKDGNAKKESFEKSGENLTENCIKDLNLGQKIDISG